MKCRGSYLPAGWSTVELHTFSVILILMTSEWFQFSSPDILRVKQLLKLNLKLISWFWPCVYFYFSLGSGRTSEKWSWLTLYHYVLHLPVFCLSITIFSLPFILPAPSFTTTPAVVTLLSVHEFFLSFFFFLSPCNPPLVYFWFRSSWTKLISVLDQMSMSPENNTEKC